MNLNIFSNLKKITNVFSDKVGLISEKVENKIQQIGTQVYQNKNESLSNQGQLTKYFLKYMLIVLNELSLILQRLVDNISDNSFKLFTQHVALTET